MLAIVAAEAAWHIFMLVIIWMGCPIDFLIKKD